MCLLKNTDVPECQRTPFITTGYRRPTNSALKCILSIFSWHCESVNIWTHLAGLLYLIYSQLNGVGQDLFFSDKFVYNVYIITAELCLFFSVLLHTFYCHNQLNPVVAKMDYFGIVVLTMGSQISGLHFALLKHSYLYTFYMSIIVVAGFFVCRETLRGNTCDIAYRCKLFSLFGSVSIITSTHLYVLNGFMGTTEILIHGVTGIYLCYGLGMMLYCISIPERWKPVKYDFIGNSHQIFHLLVLSGIYCHINMLNKMIEYTHFS
jgi:adiponectin receptor